MYNSITNAILNIDVAQRVEVFKPIIVSKDMSMDLAVFSDVNNLVKSMTAADWSSAISSLGTSGSSLSTLIAQKHSIEYFFGLNLVTSAGLTFPGILIPIFAGLTTYLSTRYMQSRQQQMTGGSEQEDMAMGMTKSLNVVMPIMMGVITINVPVALGVYWSLSNLFSILQTWATYKVLEEKDNKGELVIDEKGKLKIEDNKKDKKSDNKKGAK